MLSGREQDEQGHDGETPSLHLRFSFLHGARHSRVFSTIAVTTAIVRLSSPEFRLMSRRTSPTADRFGHGRPGKPFSIGSFAPDQRRRSRASGRIVAGDVVSERHPPDTVLDMLTEGGGSA